MTAWERHQAKAKALEVVRAGGTYKEAAEAAGVTVLTFSNWRKKDPDYAAEVKAARPS